MLEKLLRDHAVMRVKAQVLMDMLDRESIPPSDLLADARWQLSSFIMQHLAFEDRHLYAKLASDRRADVVATGAKFQADLVDLFSEYSEHAQYWTPQRIAANWQGFRAPARRMTLSMYARIDREEAELFPLVSNADINVADGAAPTTNWAREAFAIKDAMILGS